MSEDWKTRERDLDKLERHLEHELSKRGLTRRDLLKGGMAMATALGLGTLFAACGGGGGDGEGAATTAAAPFSTAKAASSCPSPSAVVRAKKTSPGRQTRQSLAHEAKRISPSRIQRALGSTSRSETARSRRTAGCIIWGLLAGRMQFVAGLQPPSWCC